MADVCILTLIEAQAVKTPDALAVAFEDAHVTYEVLNRRANQLAFHLRTLGVGLEVTVGICMQRSPELVMGMLGILKAGGAYAPHDPAHPPERLRFVLEDTRSPVLLTQRQFLDQVAVRQVHTVCLDSDWEQIAQASEADPGVGLLPQNLAYVIYTSGSTGRPKGVAIAHQALSNLTTWHRRAFAISQVDRATLIAGVSFDAAVWELWSHLAVGASLHIPDEETRATPEQLRDWFVERAITISFLPTALAKAVLSLDWPRHSALRTLLTGGEKLDRYPPPGLPFELVNNYGPTENAVVTTSGVVLPNGRGDLAPAIGSPIANVQVYILDRYLRLAPAQVMGELYIGGDSLARGYLGRSDLTAERFIPHPFSDRPGARLYRTGDVACYRPDGELEFVGRLDHQVKIRGFRVELGEVEAALQQYPAVAEAVVVAQTDASGEQCLVAYLVAGRTSPAEAPSMTIKDLRGFLKTRLPPYMLPAAFVLLAELPLTPNGKVDRQALPGVDAARLEPEEVFVAPRTPVEETLADLWRQVLGLERVGVHDHFLELGGHSLLAIQLSARLREAFHIELPVRSLFEAPTIAGLAEQIERMERRVQVTAPTPIRRAAREAPLPLSYAQQQLWLIEQLEPGNIAYNISFPLRLIGPLDPATLQRSFDEIIRRHEILRTTFAEHDKHPAPIVAPWLKLAIPLIDLCEQPADEREAAMLRLAREDARRPFDLQRGPLLHVAVLRLGECDHVLLLTLHHIVVDAWSVGVLLHELEVLYTAFQAGRRSPLPELPIQYVDYAIWQRQGSQAEELARQLAYWQTRLAGAPRVLELATDRPRPRRQTFQGARERMTLPAALSARLQQSSRQMGVTLFMTLLAAFKALLYRYTDQADIVVGAPIANRTQPEVEGLIGYFVNTLVLRTNLSGDPSFAECVERVRETALQAYANSNVPFQQLIAALRLEREQSYNPIFQVMFILQNAPMVTPRLPGLSVSPAAVDIGIAQFDLSLELEETEQGLKAEIEYNTDLFDAATTQRALAHYRVLLDRVVEDFNQPLSTLLSSIEVEPRRVATSPSGSQHGVPSNEDRVAEMKAQLSNQRAQLSAEERALLEKRLRRKKLQ